MEKEFVISIGFPQYIKDKTGTSKVILAHQNLYNSKGISYVHLFAVKKMILKDKITLFSYFGMYIDGKYEGVYTAEQVVKKIHKWFVAGHALLDIHLHHFLYMREQQINTLLSALDSAPINIYLHDYYLACTEYTLCKNKTYYCGGHGLSDQNCQGCHAYEKSQKIEPKIHCMLSKHIDRVTFISPSETTRKIFERFHPEYKGKLKVVPHQRYVLGQKANKEHINGQDAIKLAFTAMPRNHKGWETWCKLARRYNGKGYEFIVFNSSPETHENMRKHEVHFTQDNLNAMTDALLEEKVHISVLWSLCPETYSYTCFEAYSANAFIITNNISGNIADTVKREGNGLVLDSEEQLDKLLTDREELIKMVNNYRASTIGGPKKLIDNDEIIQNSLKQKVTQMVSKVPGVEIYNAPLLTVLNLIFRQ